MSDKIVIYVRKAEDRDSLVRILTANGYKLFYKLEEDTLYASWIIEAERIL